MTFQLILAIQKWQNISLISNVKRHYENSQDILSNISFGMFIILEALLQSITPYMNTCVSILLCVCICACVCISTWFCIRYIFRSSEQIFQYQIKPLFKNPETKEDESHTDIAYIPWLNSRFHMYSRMEAVFK